MLLYRCPRCGISEIENNENLLRRINLKTMNPIKIQPTWAFICAGCGWMNNQEKSELAQIA